MPDVRHDRTTQPADLRLHRVAAVEQDDVVTPFGHQRVELVRRETDAAPDDPVLVDGDLVRHAERHDLVARLDDEPREVERPAGVVEPGPVAPPHVDVVEGGVLPRLADVGLERRHVATHRGVDPMA